MEKRWRKKKYLNIPSKSFETSQKKLHHYINAPKEHSLIDHLDLFSHRLYQFAVEKPGTSGKGSDLRAPMHGRIIWQWTSCGGFFIAMENNKLPLNASIFCLIFCTSFPTLRASSEWSWLLLTWSNLGTIPACLRVKPTQWFRGFMTFLYFSHLF